MSGFGLNKRFIRVAGAGGSWHTEENAAYLLHVGLSPLVELSHDLRDVREFRRRFGQAQPLDRCPLVLRRLLLRVQVNEPKRGRELERSREITNDGLGNPEVLVLERRRLQRTAGQTAS